MLNGGLNVEVSDTYTVQRRPGFVKFCTVPLLLGEVVKQFYSIRSFNGDVVPLLDTSYGLYKFSPNSKTQIVNKTTPDQGFVQQVGGLVYYSDGVEAIKYNHDEETVMAWGIKAPTTSPVANPNAIVSVGTGVRYNFWNAGARWATGAILLDYNGNAQQAGSGSQSGVLFPVWSPTAQGATLDGGATWTNLGPFTDWLAATDYIAPTVTVDTNNNLQVLTSVVDPGTSSPSVPIWNSVYGGTTTDGDLTWTNYGPGQVAAYSGWSWVYAFRTVDGHLSTASPSSLLGETAISPTSTGPVFTRGDATVSSYTIIGNYCQMTCNNQFAAGELIELSGFPNSWWFNNQVVQVSAIDASTAPTYSNQEEDGTSKHGSSNWQLFNNNWRTIVHNVTTSPVGMTAFGFSSMADTDKIVGVETTFYAYLQFHDDPAHDSSTALNSVQLIYQGNPIGSTRGGGESLPQNDQTKTFKHGNPNDLWGVALTPGMVKDASFGFQVTFNQGPSRTFVGNSFNNQPWGHFPGAWGAFHMKVYYVPAGSIVVNSTTFSFPFTHADIVATETGVARSVNAIIHGQSTVAGTAGTPTSSTGTGPAVDILDSFPGPDPTALNPWTSYELSGGSVSIPNPNQLVLKASGTNPSAGTVALPVGTWLKDFSIANFTLSVGFTTPTSGLGGTIGIVSKTQYESGGESAVPATGIWATLVRGSHPTYTVGNASPATYTDATITLDNAVHALVVTGDGAGNIGFSIDGGTVHTLTANAGLGVGETLAIFLDTQYSGSGNSIIYISAVELTVTAAATATAFVTPLSSGDFGSAVTFNVSCTGATSGTIEWSDGATPLASTVLAGGNSALTISSLGYGLHEIQARLDGTNIYNSSFAITPYTVLGAAAPANTDGRLNAVSTIQAVKVVNNIVTIYAPNTFAGGVTVQIAGMYKATFLNNQFLTVATADSSSFTATFVHADLGLQEDIGTVTLCAIEVYRTRDGGGTYQFAGAIVNAQNWVFYDAVPDNLLDELQLAPLAHLNDPPPGQPGSLEPTGGTILAWWNGRLWMASGSRLYFSGGPDVLNGIPEDAWPPANVFRQTGNITGLAATSQGLLVFLGDKMRVVLGGPQTLTFYDVDVLDHFGVSSPNCIAQDGDELYIYTTGKQYYALNAGGKTEEGQRIGDFLATNFPADVSYATIHRNGLDSGTFLANGTDSCIRYGLNLQAWSPVAKPVFGGGLGALKSIETAVGTYSLMAAEKGVPTPAKGATFAASWDGTKIVLSNTNELYPQGQQPPTINDITGDFNVTMKDPYGGTDNNNGVKVFTTGNYLITYAASDNIYGSYSGPDTPTIINLKVNGATIATVTADAERMLNYAAFHHLASGDIVTLDIVQEGPRAGERFSVVMCGGLGEAESATFNGVVDLTPNDYLGPWIISPGATHIAAGSTFGINILQPGWYEVEVDILWDVTAANDGVYATPTYADAASALLQYAVDKVDLSSASVLLMGFNECPGVTGTTSFKCLVKAVDITDALAPTGIGSYTQLLIEAAAAITGVELVPDGTFDVTVIVRPLLGGR